MTTEPLSRRTVLRAIASFSCLGSTLVVTDNRLPATSISPSATLTKSPIVKNTSITPPEVVFTFTAAPTAHYPFRENMYRALQLQDGRIISLSIARKEGQQTTQGRYSTDDGYNWSTPEDLFQWPRAEGGFAIFNALVDREGEIHIFTLCDGNSGILFPKSEEEEPIRSGEILDIWYVRSRGGLLHWDKPKPIWKGHGDDLLSVIQLRSGRLLLPFSSVHDCSWEGNRGKGFFDYTYVGTYRISALYSDDGGETWQQSPDELVVETPDLSTYGANEPVVLELRDGRVWMLMRTQRGRFYESFSSDEGTHWTPPQPTSLISSDSPAALLRLRDGSILLFSNACLRYPYAYGGRYVLHVAISEDEGRTWYGFREVARDRLRNQPPPRHADYGVAYSFPTLLANGKVLFSNWVVPCGRYRSFRILDPRWVFETRQSTDFSNGLNDWSVLGTKGVELQPDPKVRGSKVLAVHKADVAWPAGAVWNFPSGSRGRLILVMKIHPNFGGILLGLTDHFSVPWDLEDLFSNVFNVHIREDRRIVPNFRLTEDQWHEVTLDWSTGRRQCRIKVDRHIVGEVQINRQSKGVNYLRVRSMATLPDSGIQLRSVRVTVD